MSDQQWLDVADAILDGRTVAWDSLPAERTSDDLITADELRLIADVAHAHRTIDATGLQWGPFELLERIGHGTFADVFRARDTTLDRDVALKLLDRTGTVSIDEGKLLARVRHPNVVTVHGAAAHDGRYGIWMEFVRGRTLAAIMREHGPLPWREVVQIGADVCTALEAVHASGLLHGDVKAQNVMREHGGRIVLMDFGTGRFVADPTTRLAGTPLYLAPEVLDGKAPDARADVYSAGVLLYYLLTGEYPVEGDTLSEIRAAHDGAARTPLESRRPDLPWVLIRAVNRAIAPDPSQRFESAATFGRALSTAIRSRAAARLTASIAIGVMIALLAGVGWWRMTVSGPRRASIEPVTTTSAEALRLYDQSYELGYRQDWNGALRLVNQAISADEQFALAHVWQAWCLWNTGAPSAEVFTEGKRALDLSSRVSDWERLWIESSYRFFIGDTDKEIAALKALLRLRPDHYWAVNNLYNALTGLDQERQAIPYVVQRASLRPDDGPANNFAASVLMHDGQIDNALKFTQRGRSDVDREGWFKGAATLWTLPVEALMRRGDLRGAAMALDALEHECAQMAATPRLGIGRYIVTFNLSLGRGRAAEAAADLIPTPNERHFNRAAVAFHRGDREAFQREMSLVAGDATAGDSRPFYLIQAGQLDEAEWEMKQGQEHSGEGQVELANVELAKGNRSLALTMLLAAHPARGLSLKSELLTQLYVEQGDRAQAIKVLEDTLNDRMIFPYYAHWWMRNEVRLAELYHESGRDGDAVHLEADLDNLLSVADRDFPLLVRLKALEASSTSSKR